MFVRFHLFRIRRKLNRQNKNIYEPIVPTDMSNTIFFCFEV